MTQVSTSAQLLHSLKLDDFIYGVVGTQASEPEVGKDNGVKLWNIPGLGMLGVGAATATLIGWYVANPRMKEDLEVIGDFFSDKDRDTRLDDAAEMLGTKGAEFDPNAGDTPDGTPRIAQTTPVPLPTPKAEPKPVDAPTAAPPTVQVPTEVQVSRGYQVQGSSMPAPSNLARPTAEINEVLKNTAKTEGVDYRTLYALAGSESSFRAGANASSSSAVGLFQFTSPTWNYLTQKVYPELGYKADDRLDPQKSAILGARYIKSIQASLNKKLGRAPSLGETYLGYFMGPTGAHKFLDALKSNPNAKGADVFSKAADANPNLFYHKGDRNKPLTLQETMDRLEGKVTAYAEQAGAVQVAKAEAQVPDIKGSGGAVPIPVKAVIPVSASPQAAAVPAPDFEAVKGGSKGEARNQEQPGKANAGTQQGASTKVATSGGGKSSDKAGEVSYVRDKHGRLITIRS
jgi:hypothetical protein